MKTPSQRSGGYRIGLLQLSTIWKKHVVIKKYLSTYNSIE